MKGCSCAIKPAHFPAHHATMENSAVGIRLGEKVLAVLMAAAISVSAAPWATAVEKASPPEAAFTPPPPPPPSQPAPYDRDLMRLSEILGAVHYLRGLCNAGGEDHWRVQMQKLLDLEAGKEPLRRQKFTGAFNHGYRSFASMHVTCTEAALAAEARYRAEGATLAAEITARFGN